MAHRLSSNFLSSDQIYTSCNADRSRIHSSEFIDCSFIDCTFIEAELKDCRFVNCKFRNCDLSLGKIIGSTFINTSFDQSKIIGGNWAQADWSASDLGTPISFNKSALNHSTFIGLSLQGIQIIDCQAVNVDFREADLTKADFAGSDLSESLFIHTNLSAADLSRARNYQINPGMNTLEKAKFSLPEAMSLLDSMDIILTDGNN